MDLSERGFAERTVVQLRDVPNTVREFVMLRSSDTDLPEFVLDGTKSVFPIGELQSIAEVPDNLYLLYYRFEGGDSGTVYLKNVRNGEVARKWRIPLQKT